MRKLFFFLLLLVGCDATPASRSEIESWIRDEWAIAQDELVVRYPDLGAKPFVVYADQFDFVEHPEPFGCGSGLVNGCHRVGRFLIEYNAQTPNVIRHEAKHAILWRLGDKRHECVEHTC